MGKYDHADELIESSQATVTNLEIELAAFRKQRDNMKETITGHVTRIDQINTTIALLKVHAPRAPCKPGCMCPRCGRQIAKETG